MAFGSIHQWTVHRPCHFTYRNRRRCGEMFSRCELVFDLVGEAKVCHNRVFSQVQSPIHISKSGWLDADIVPCGVIVIKWLEFALAVSNTCMVDGGRDVSPGPLGVQVSIGVTDKLMVPSPGRPNPQELFVITG